MSLPTPVLDDRSYAQLRDELLRRIPVYAPEWTDHNASDPGVTLLELMAFLGENLLFRFNQIPEATKLAYLDLLGLSRRPASPARAIVAMTSDLDPTAGPEAVLVVDQGAKALAGKLPFETEDEVAVLPVEVRVVARQREEGATLTADQLDEVNRVLVARGGLAEGEEAAYYSVQTVPLDPMAPGAGVVDFATVIDDTVWVAVLAADAAPDDTTKDRRRQQLAGSILNLGIVFDEELADEIEACPGADAATDPGPSLQWQVSTGELTTGGAPRYLAVDIAGDGTAGLTRNGVIRLTLPGEFDAMGVFAPDDPDLAGAGDLPPELADEEETARVLCWLRGFRPDDEEPFGRVRWGGVNAAATVQMATALPEFLGTGTGDSAQEYPLVHTPVIDGTVLLQVEETGGWVEWRQVEDFDASGEDDRHYVLDPRAGTITFGSVTGRPPQLGERIRVKEYRYGGGVEGNVAAGTITKVEGHAAVKVVQPLPAAGGVAEETVAAALDRIPAELRRRDRAVAAEDFESLAGEVSGVGRAEVMARFHPTTQAFEVPGVVTVVVWPDEDAKHPDAPVPTRALVDAVCAHLDERRLVTTELYVVKPTYRQVAVAVGLEVAPGFGPLAVRRWVELVVRQYLAPLPPYGPDGGGWPLGRRVHAPELEAAALQVEGVEYLEGIRVARWDQGTSAWVEGNVDLMPWEVPELAEITVVAGSALAPGVAVAPAPSGDVPVPLPVPPGEEC